MNQRIRIFVSTAFIAVSCCLFSCKEEIEGFGVTGKDGLPSAFKTDNKTVYLSYGGNRLLKIDKGGFTTSFTYEGNELRSILFAPPPDPTIADGHGSIHFEKEGHKIIVKQCAEPSMSISYNKELELDENGLPTKITELGAFQITGEGEKKVCDGKYFFVLTFDSSTKNLLKSELFSLEDSKLLRTYTFKYSDAPGTMSRVELPVWFFGYWSQIQSSGLALFSDQFLNYRNTLTTKTVTDEDTGISHTIEYTYVYNQNTYPISVDNKDCVMDIIY